MSDEDLKVDPVFKFANSRLLLLYASRLGEKKLESVHKRVEEGTKYYSIIYATGTGKWQF